MVNRLTLEPSIGDVTGLDSIQVTPNRTTVYTLTAENSAGQDSEAVIVTVKLPPAIIGLAADPEAVNPGGSSTLRWTISGEAEHLVIDQGVGDVTGKTQAVVHPAVTTTYRLTASNSAGSDAEEVTVAVKPDITSFTAKPTTITPGSGSSPAMGRFWQCIEPEDRSTCRRGHRVDKCGSEAGRDHYLQIDSHQ